MRALPVLLLAAATVAAPLAAASHWDATDSADCQLFGALACSLTLTVSPAVQACNDAGCTFFIDCFWTISGVLARAEGTCHGVPWVQPCGTGSCDGGIFAGILFAPRGQCTPVTAAGVGHGLVVDATRVVAPVSQICI